MDFVKFFGGTNMCLLRWCIYCRRRWHETLFWDLGPEFNSNPLSPAPWRKPVWQWHLAVWRRHYCQVYQEWELDPTQHNDISINSTSLSNFWCWLSSHFLTKIFRMYNVVSCGKSGESLMLIPTKCGSGSSRGKQITPLSVQCLNQSRLSAPCVI